MSAGLDSLVVGEPQILGQVKDAFQAAAQRHCTGPLLGKVFEWAFGVGKRVRTETTLGEGAVSVSYAAVALARKIFGRLQGRRVLVVGAGEISTLTAQHLRSHGVAEIAITSRTPAHAEALAAAVDGTGGGLERDDGRRSSRADIVITATGSQRPILTRAHIEAVTGRRRPDPLFIIDIAVPRDVEPAVGDIEQVFLYNVDDLQGIVEENMSRRGAEIARAEAIVSEELARFTAWQRSRAAIPTVVALRQRFDAIRRAELQRLEGKLAGLPPEATGRVDEVTRLIVEKLLIEPTEQLKALPDEETQVAYTEAVNRLFRLREDDDAGFAVRESANRPQLGGDHATRALPTARCSPRRHRGTRSDPVHSLRPCPHGVNGCMTCEPVGTLRVSWAVGVEMLRGETCKLSRLGTRGSQLALFQAHSVADLLRERAGVDVRDRRHQDVRRSARRGAALRDRRQAALREGNRGRAAVGRDRSRRAQQQGHAGGAARRPRLGAVLPREDPRDAVVLPAESETRVPPRLTLDAIVTRLGRAPRIGTSSVRRSAQLTRLFPGRAVPAGAREPRHAARQAGRARRLRRAGPGGGRPETAATRGAHLRPAAGGRVRACAWPGHHRGRGAGR